MQDFVTLNIINQRRFTYFLKESITVWLTSCFIFLVSAVWLMLK